MLSIKVWIANFKQLSKKQKIIIFLAVVFSIILLISVVRQNNEKFGGFLYPNFERTVNLNESNLLKILALTYYTNSSTTNLFSYKPEDYLSVYKIKVVDSNLDTFIKNNNFIKVSSSNDEFYTYKSDTLGCYLYRYNLFSDIECANSPVSLDVISIFPGLNIVKTVNGEAINFLENDKEVYLYNLKGFIDLEKNSLTVSNWSFIDIANSNYRSLSVIESLFAYSNIRNIVGVRVINTDLRVCSGEGCSNFEFVDVAHPQSMDLLDVKLVYFKTKSLKDKRYDYLIPYYKLRVKGSVNPDYPLHWPEDYVKTLPTKAHIYYDIFIPAISPNYLVVGDTNSN